MVRIHPGEPIRDIHARRVKGCDDCVIEINPRHAGFYARALGFEAVGRAKQRTTVHLPQRANGQWRVERGASNAKKEGQHFLALNSGHKLLLSIHLGVGLSSRRGVE